MVTMTQNTSSTLRSTDSIQLSPAKANLIFKNYLGLHSEKFQAKNSPFNSSTRNSEFLPRNTGSFDTKHLLLIQLTAALIVQEFK